jgi:hypothetical protein
MASRNRRFGCESVFLTHFFARFEARFLRNHSTGSSEISGLGVLGGFNPQFSACEIRGSRTKTA